MINTTPTKSMPEINLPSQHDRLPPSGGKKRKRGLIWVVFLLTIAAVAGYTVWRAGHPAATPRGQGGGGGGRGGGRFAGLGPVPVVVAKVTRSSVPVYLNGLGNVAAF